MPDTVLGFGDTAVNKTNKQKILALMELTF